MAYVSRRWQNTWTYDPEKTNEYNTKVATLLNNGVDYKTYRRIVLRPASAPVGTSSLKRCGEQEALSELKEALPAQSARTMPKGPSALSSSLAGSTGREAQFAWVNDKGQTVRVPGLSTEKKVAKHRGTEVSVQRPATAVAREQQLDRSVHLWGRVCPRVMPQTTKTPSSTMKDHFEWRTNMVEPTDFTYHLKKTDFSEYTEVATKIMNKLKSAN